MVPGYPSWRSGIFSLATTLFHWDVARWPIRQSGPGLWRLWGKHTMNSGLYHTS